MAPQRAPEKPAPRGFDAELAMLDGIASLPREQALPLLRRALTNRSNLLVSRAAKHAARLDARELAGELVDAFRRFLENPAKSDPQCWAKNELAKALSSFEEQIPEIFFLGLRHIQLEGTWGGVTDTAGTLRGICALALLHCRDVPSAKLLRDLVPLLHDPELPVRITAARAIEGVNTDSAALLLRLRAELASDEPEFLAACITGVLRIEGPPALPWLANFLAQEDALAAETAFVLAEHRSVEAIAILREAHGRARDRDFRATLLTALATTRLPEAIEWLLALIATQSLDARTAAKALCETNPSPEVLARLSALHFPCKNP